MNQFLEWFNFNIKIEHFNDRGITGSNYGRNKVSDDTEYLCI